MELTKIDFSIIRQFVHALCGIDLGEDKEYLIHQRLEPVAVEQGCKNFQEFALLLRAAPDQALRDQVVAAITTNETSFFRDGHPYKLFRSVILPQLADIAVKRKSQPFLRRGPKISLLSAGSSTGQEPYCMSITIHDFLQFNSGYNLSPGDFVILATDLSSRVLAKAMAGEYNEFEVNRGLSDMQKNVYFTRTASSWIIKDYIKSIIEFRRVNLVEPVSYLGAFDVIFCRNVLIYFDIKTRQQIFDQFHKMLNEGGIMVLGSTENIFGISEKFESVHEGESVYYRKIGV